MSDTNGVTKTPGKRIRPRIDIIWTEKDVEEIHAMSNATGKSMKEIVQTATRAHLAKEKKRLRKLLSLHAKLVGN